MSNLLRLMFFVLFVRPVVWLMLGLNVRRAENLPKAGPAVLVANHNSHLDTLVLMTLLPISLLPRLRPVAAAQYFLRNQCLAWFATKIIGIIPIRAGTGQPKEEVLAEVSEALRQGNIVILFPEGTRGEPESLAEFKSGIAVLAELHSDVPIYPIYLHGLGKALPKGEWLLVPFFCDVFVGEPMGWAGDGATFMQGLDHCMKNLVEEGNFAAWR